MSARILHVRSSAGFFGAERVILTLMANTSDDDVEAHLACIENYLNGEQSLFLRAQEAGMNVVEAPCRSRIDFGTIFYLKQYCKKEKINIIHCHDYKSLFYGLLVAKLTSCKLMATLHGKTSGDAKNRLYEFVENRLLGFADHITVVSKPLYEMLAKGTLKNKISLIANGVNEEQFNSTVKGFGKECWGFTKGCFLFGTIARMSEEKGHHFLIDAFSDLANKIKNARLLLVGDGPLEQDLKDLVEKKGLVKTVCFAGPQKDVARILNDLDCYISPSHTEGMPMSILEAMSCSLPIIATEVGSVGEMLSDGAGQLIRTSDKNSLVARMQSIIGEPEEAKNMGAIARVKVESLYSGLIQRNEYAIRYHSLLGK